MRGGQQCSYWLAPRQGHSGRSRARAISTPPDQLAAICSATHSLCGRLPSLARAHATRYLACNSINPGVCRCRPLVTSYRFLFPFETRRRFFYCTSFGLARALAYLQQVRGGLAWRSAGPRDVQRSVPQRSLTRHSHVCFACFCSVPGLPAAAFACHRNYIMRHPAAGSISIQVYNKINGR